MAYSKGEGARDADYAKGGGTLGRTRDFLKEPDAFRTDTGSGAKQDYVKPGKGGEGKDKCLPAIKPRS